jgi:hypothetical protein
VPSSWQQVKPRSQTVNPKTVERDSDGRRRVPISPHKSASVYRWKALAISIAASARFTAESMRHLIADFDAGHKSGCPLRTTRNRSHRRESAFPPNRRKSCEKRAGILRISIHSHLPSALCGDTFLFGLRAHAGSHRVDNFGPAAWAQQVTTFSHTVVCRSPL